MRLTFSACVVTLVLTGALFAQSAEQGQTPPVFRAETRLVPVDVRVVDQNRKPITNLTQADFTVFEDGVRQDIRQFSTHLFTPDPAAASDDAALPTFRAAGAPLAGDELAPANRRVFLILFGRGDVQSVGKGIDGILNFVRHTVMPQDLVAVVAWNRATEFTTDHAKIAALIERFKGVYRDVDAKLRVRNDILSAIYQGDASRVTRNISPAVQKQIDAVFGPAGAKDIRTVVPGQSVNAAQMAADARRSNEEMQAAIDAAAAAEDTAAQTDAQTSLDEFMAGELQTMEDLGNLYLAIDYLQHLQGEKHLVFVSETGLAMARTGDDEDLAAAAASGRVAIDYIHTGGQGRGPNLGLSNPARVGGAGPPPPPPRMAAPQQSPFAARTARTLATLTGGTSYWNRLNTAKDDLTALDEVTRFQYVLGYYSSRPLDGRLRNIVVRVNRPGLTVMYRRGYYATPQLAPFDRQRVLTNSRISMAATTAEPIRDIPMRATASSAPPTAQGIEIKTEVSVEATALRFARNNGRNTASVVLAVWYLAKDDELIRQAWGNVDLSFTDDELKAMADKGVPVSLNATVTGPVTNVKIVLYQYAADRVGSAVAKVR